MNTESVRSSRQVDLAKLTRDFTKWQGKYQDLILQNGQLEQQLQALTGQCERNRTTHKSAEEELKQLRGIIASLQDTLAKRCDLEDENKSLKEQVCNMEERARTLKEEGQAALVETEARLEEAHAKDKEQMEEIHREEIKQMEEQARALEKSVLDRLAEVKQLQIRLAESEKDRQTEIVKLRLEYDAKLLKLQSTSSRTGQVQRSDKPGSASSLIFREKMLNAQAASEREVASLRQTISDLKRKLDSRQGSSSAKRKH